MTHTDLSGLIANECANPHSRAKSKLTEGVESGHPDNRPGAVGAARGTAPGVSLMHADRTFRWTVTGESYREGSSDPWRGEFHEAEITAESLGEALEKIVTGLGEGVTNDNAIPWDIIDQDREVTITIRPTSVETDEENR